MPRMAYGHQCGMMFRKYGVGHSAPLEFGTTEAGARNEGEIGTKAMNEGFLQVSSCSKGHVELLVGTSE